MAESYTLRQIAPLIRDMAAHHIKQDRIQYEFNGVRIDVLVLIDREPFELLFGIIDYNFAFTLHMANGYQLEFLPDDVYYRLRDILNIHGHMNRFTSFSFIHDFAQRIPQRYSGQIIQPHEIAVHVVNDVTNKTPIDESDKIYFKGWQTHVTDGRKAQNFEKTRKFLGEEAYQFCKANNISSCWGAEPAEAKTYETPQAYIFRKKS